MTPLATASASRTAPAFPLGPVFFVALLALALAGFWPSYFARLADTDLPHHLHGITATAWMALLVAQATLVRTRRVALHRALGRVSYGLVPLFLVSGLLMMRTMHLDTGPFAQRFGASLAFVDGVALAGFAGCYVLALRHRRQMALHGRWMAVTGILVLPPALARLIGAAWPGIGGFVPAAHLAFALSSAIAAAMVVVDARRGAPAAPSRVALALMLLQHAGFAVLVARG